MSIRILGLFFALSVLQLCPVIGDEKEPLVELMLSLYPKELAFGDTCYVYVTATNHYDERVGVTEPGFLYPGYDMVQFNLSRNGKTWRGTFESCHNIEFGSRWIGGFWIPSGESLVFLAASLQFPPLEDLYQDAFWEEIREELKDNPDGLSFEFGIEFLRPREKDDKLGVLVRMTHQVTIHLRSDREMEMINQWYCNTPERYFPVIKELPQGAYKVPRGPVHMECKCNILGQSIWKFIRTGNRYPSDTNAPTTWKEWQELEESIVPSTMRDEIRLTRMLIQYYVTEDKAVLDELKEWFAGMNEVQRTCMARSVWNRQVGWTHCEPFLPAIDELYRVISEYDITAKFGGIAESLKKLELLE